MASRTPVLDSLLSRQNAAGTMLGFGDSVNRNAGQNLLDERASEIRHLRNIEGERRRASDALRQAQARARGAGSGSSAGGLSKWNNYASEQYDFAAEAIGDLREAAKLVQAVQAEGGEATQPLLEIGTKLAEGAAGPELAQWLNQSFKTPAQRRLATHLRNMDQKVRNKMYGSALTQGEVSYSLGTMLGGAMSDDELTSRVNDSMSRTQGRLKRLMGSYNATPFLKEEASTLMEPWSGGATPAAGSPAPEGSVRFEALPADAEPVGLAQEDLDVAQRMYQSGQLSDDQLDSFTDMTPEGRAYITGAQ